MFISHRFPLYLVHLPSAGIPCHSSLRFISSPSLLTAALSDLAGAGAGGWQEEGPVIRRRSEEWTGCSHKPLVLSTQALVGWTRYEKKAERMCVRKRRMSQLGVDCPLLRGT